MELERHFIERKDFPAARRGYDPDDVDRHLRAIADAVTELKRSRSAKPAGDAGGVASAAADQVRAIVEAAEQSAAQIQERADQESRRIRSEAERDSRQTRERADADAAEHVRKVEEATRAMQERARAVEAEIESLLGGLHETTNSLVESLRATSETLAEEVRQSGGQLRRSVEASADALVADLDAIRTGLGDVREARGGGMPGESVVEQPAVFEADELAEPVQETPLSAVPDLDEELSLDYEEDDDFASEVPEEEQLESAARVAAAPEPEAERVTEPEPQPEPEPESEPEPQPEPARTVAGGEGARLIALNMALNGTPREETARYLAENFELADQDAILDDVYSRAGQS